MNKLQIFRKENFHVRTMLVNDEPYFVAKDVAEVLGYSETSMMTRRLDDD